MVATIMAFALVSSLGMNAMFVSAQEENETASPQQDGGQLTENQLAELGETEEQQDEQQETATAPQTVINNAACGQVVEGIVTLTANLNCADTDGLIVGDDGAVINLNGFTLSGPGKTSSKVGIAINNQDDVSIVGGGSITGFQAAIMASSENLNVEQVTLTDNKIGVFLMGQDGAMVTGNIIQGNDVGIASHSSQDITTDMNQLSQNGLAAVTLVNTDDSTISLNNIAETGQGLTTGGTGIFLDAQSNNNLIDSNNVLRNTVDINNANGLAPNINTNTFQANNCILSNPSGLCTGR
jgi:parallel beta-helix repeat protein